MKKQDAGRKQLGNFADKFAELNDDVLFGEVWSRDDKLSTKQRCIITLVALISQGIVDNSLSYHLTNAKNNGVSKTEIAEIITHIAFYVGWPKAWAAFNMAKEIWTEDDEMSQYQNSIMFPIGKKNDGFAKYFIGQSYLYELSSKPIGIYNVTFEPGCRNNWHIHRAKNGGGQILVCIGGKGVYQQEGEKPVIMEPGSIINIPANVKHWHGALKNHWFSHLAIEVPGEETFNEWLEPVENEYYEKIGE